MITSLDNPGILPLTAAQLTDVIRATDGVDVGEIIWAHAGMTGFGFTVVGNDVAAFGRFLIAVNDMFHDNDLMQVFVDRVVPDRTNIRKVVFFPVQLIAE